MPRPPPPGGDVLPTPTTLNIFGVDVHVQLPPFTDVNSDPATVNNFHGASGVAGIDTSLTRTHRETGESRVLPSNFNHMVFMQGVYRGRDGRVHDGTFAFV